MKISNLKFNPNNPRTIDVSKFKKLVKSIETFPKMLELRPIVYNPETMEILGGNMRLKALQELKYKEIPDKWIKSAESLTEEEKKRFIIEDNVGFGEWDFDILANEWEAIELEEWGVDLPIQLDSEINDINEVDSFSESVNFTIKCDSIEQLNELQTKLSIDTQKISCTEFFLKAGL